MLDYRDLVDGADYRQTIFIFISNIGSNEIKKQYEQLIDLGKKREDIVFENFEKIIEEGAFKHEGNFLNN